MEMHFKALLEVLTYHLRGCRDTVQHSRDLVNLKKTEMCAMEDDRKSNMVDSSNLHLAFLFKLFSLWFFILWFYIIISFLFLWAFILCIGVSVFHVHACFLLSYLYRHLDLWIKLVISCTYRFLSGFVDSKYVPCSQTPTSCLFSLTRASLVESGLSPGLLTLKFLLMSLSTNRSFSRLVNRTFLVERLSRRLATLSEYLLSSGHVTGAAERILLLNRVKLSLLYGGGLIRLWFLRSLSHLSIDDFFQSFILSSYPFLPFLLVWPGFLLTACLPSSLQGC